MFFLRTSNFQLNNFVGDVLVKYFAEPELFDAVFNVNEAYHYSID